MRHLRLVNDWHSTRPIVSPKVRRTLLWFATVEACFLAFGFAIFFLLRWLG